MVVTLLPWTERIVVTQELPAKSVTEPKPGIYVFDLGQNFAGVVRLKVKGAAGTQVRLRYGEMLHADGTIMTENLRKARATDFYTLRGEPAGETWSPRFTYHGFQYVELTGLAEKPAPGAITGLVLHNDTPLAGSFECSDPVLTQFGLVRRAGPLVVGRPAAARYALIDVSARSSATGDDEGAPA